MAIPCCPTCTTTYSVHHTTWTMMSHRWLVNGEYRDCPGSGEKCVAKPMGASYAEMQARLQKWRRSVGLK